MNKSVIEDALNRSRHPSARERRWALLELCPCEVRANIPEVWDRLFEMQADGDSTVRSLVLRVLCDGSPAEREDEVVRIVAAMQNDPDVRLRRRARRTMAEYRRTGRINQE